MHKYLLLILLTMLSLCSCNKGKLEWWEVVNAPEKRLEKASGRNDNTKMEKYLFEKMDELESEVSGKRVESWADSDNPLLVGLNLFTIFLMLSLIVLGLVVKYKDIYSAWPMIVLAFLTTLLVIIYLPHYLYVANGTKGNTTDIGPVIALLGLVLCVPYVLYPTDADIPTIPKIAYSIVIPFAMIGGAFFRVLATWGSYLFVLLMIVDVFFYIRLAKNVKTGLFILLFGIVYRLIITLGTLIVFYSAMPAMVSVFNSLLLLLIAYLVLTGYASSSPTKAETSGSSDTKEDDSVDYYGPDNMENTYEKDADGNEIFRSKSDDRYYKRGWTGFDEVDKP